MEPQRNARDAVGPPAPLLGAGDVARLLGVTRGWVYRAVRRQEFPAVRVGRALRFEAAAVAGWIVARRTREAPEAPGPSGGGR